MLTNQPSEFVFNRRIFFRDLIKLLTLRAELNINSENERNDKKNNVFVGYKIH